jgi:RES domain-containing protein
LKELVHNNAVERVCSYCARRGRKAIAASSDVILAAIASAVFRFYADPTQAGVPYDGGFIVEPTYTADVLLSLPLACHADFFADVVDAFGDAAWVPAADGHWLADHEHVVLRDSWGKFVRAVKHETRFHFADAPPDPNAGPFELSPGQVLSTIGNVVVELGLVKTISAGVEVYRARQRDDPKAWQPDASTMGPPPPGLARAGRMNPAGIRYFYCTFERGTAVAEVASSPPLELVIAKYTTAHTLNVLDLCDLPGRPSLFDCSKALQYEWLTFLDGFVAEISQPVRKDGREHIDYVPSQVVCEWFAQAFQPPMPSGQLDGLIYPSAVARSGKNLVLFPSVRRYERAFSAVEFQSAEVVDLPDWDALRQPLARVGLDYSSSSRLRLLAYRASRKPTTTTWLDGAQGPLSDCAGTSDGDAFPTHAEMN